MDVEVRNSSPVEVQYKKYEDGRAPPALRTVKTATIIELRFDNRSSVGEVLKIYPKSPDDTWMKDEYQVSVGANDVTTKELVFHDTNISEIDKASIKIEKSTGWEEI